MATQIDNATMTVTVNEDVKLNGQQVGSKIVQQIGGINEASRRIFSVSVAETEILALSSSAGAGTYVTSNLQYIRVTNLDDTNFVRLTFASGSLNPLRHEIAGKTHCYLYLAIYFWIGRGRCLWFLCRL